MASAVASEVATAAAAASLNNLKIELWMFDIGVRIALGYLTVQLNRNYFPEKYCYPQNIFQTKSK